MGTPCNTPCTCRLLCIISVAISSATITRRLQQQPLFQLFVHIFGWLFLLICAYKRTLALLSVYEAELDSPYCCLCRCRWFAQFGTNVAINGFIRGKSFYFNHTSNHFVCLSFSCFSFLFVLFVTKFELSPNSINLHVDFRCFFRLDFVKHYFNRFSSIYFNWISHPIRSNEVIAYKSYYFFTLSSESIGIEKRTNIAKWKTVTCTVLHTWSVLLHTSPLLSRPIIWCGGDGIQSKFVVASSLTGEGTA